MNVELFFEKATVPFATLTVTEKYISDYCKNDPEVYLKKSAVSYAESLKKVVTAKTKGYKEITAKPKG